ncbi:acyl-protein thioesterase 1 homolog 1-like isoform X2 [Dioscorea cayenensis subsp. rotundata]|uniref:Acyl-protein thioesterase 1 homolog 1-like isoform X2 n=1 Tax=Dioscorea cayennensis subsp. rotundata TaxID=55577 RepID=A0AB40B5U2_DIOCR|nr:acyl-protein thioesterase 1 homolog 1-like isoform X2 [Dioscorea cayenensis subsp. rotundata]
MQVLVSHLFIDSLTSPKPQKKEFKKKNLYALHSTFFFPFGIQIQFTINTEGPLSVLFIAELAYKCSDMNYGSSSRSSGFGNRTSRRSVEYGRTYVVKPKGRHQATIVWLHGLGDNGASWSQILETLPHPNIKWICPTAPTRPVASFGGFSCTAWFDAGDFSEEGPDDIEGMDASAAHVANLLSTEPANIKLGIGGFSMGAAIALYSATCYIHGKFGNGNPYPINLSVIIGFSGWLPCYRSLKSKVEVSQDAIRRAAALPVLLCHGRGDDVVMYEQGEKSAEVLRSAGFQNFSFKTYNGLGHYTSPEEMDDFCKWLRMKMGLDGSRSY